jgi:hypothetical protein
MELLAAMEPLVATQWNHCHFVRPSHLVEEAAVVELRLLALSAVLLHLQPCVFRSSLDSEGCLR